MPLLAADRVGRSQTTQSPINRQGRSTPYRTGKCFNFKQATSLPTPIKYTLSTFHFLRCARNLTALWLSNVFQTHSKKWMLWSQPWLAAFVTGVFVLKKEWVMDRTKMFSTISSKQGGFHVIFGERSNTEKVKDKLRSYREFPWSCTTRPRRLTSLSFFPTNLNGLTSKS